MEKMEKIWLGFLGVVVIGLLVYTGIRDWRGIQSYQKMSSELEQEEKYVREQMEKIDEHIIKAKIYQEMRKYKESKKNYELAKNLLKNLMKEENLKQKYNLEEIYKFCSQNITQLSRLSAK